MIEPNGTNSVGDARLRHDLRGRDAHEQLAFHAVARAVLRGPLRTHVAPADACRPAAQQLGIVEQRRRAVDAHVRVRRGVFVHAQRHAPVAAQRLAFDALAPGREEQRAVVVDAEPDGHHHRTAVETHEAELARARPERQEGADLRLVHPSHLAPPGWTTRAGYGRHF